MPSIRITRLDLLGPQAIEELRHLDRFALCDWFCDFEMDRIEHVAKLRAIIAEVESLGLPWLEFYCTLAYDVQTYETERDARD
jgi:hypothetical protein